MLYVSLRQRIVERNTDPTSKQYMQIKRMVARPIDDVLANSLFAIPRIGETICLDKEHSYDVINVIHSLGSRTELRPAEIIVEVVPHVADHLYDAGSYSFKEDWPLISDLESEDENQ